MKLLQILRLLKHWRERLKYHGFLIETLARDQGNTLATVQAIAAQTLSNSKSLW